MNFKKFYPTGIQKIGNRRYMINLFDYFIKRIYFYLKNSIHRTITLSFISEFQMVSH